MFHRFDLASFMNGNSKLFSTEIIIIKSTKILCHAYFHKFLNFWDFWDILILLRETAMFLVKRLVLTWMQQFHKNLVTFLITKFVEFFWKILLLYLLLNATDQQINVKCFNVIKIASYALELMITSTNYNQIWSCANFNSFKSKRSILLKY